MKKINNLQFHNFGRSRGRIVLVRDHTIKDPGEPGRVDGTRWIVFGNALYDLNILFSQNSYLTLNEGPTAVPGGMSSALWQKITSNPTIHYTNPQPIPDTKLMIRSYGRESSRIVLVDTLSSRVFSPSRLGETSWIAINPAAKRQFNAWFKTLPGATAATIDAIKTAVPGTTIGGGTLNRLRAAVN